MTQDKFQSYALQCRVNETLFAQIMSITVKFFGALRETCQAQPLLIEPQNALTAADIWLTVCPNIAQPVNTLVAVNREYVKNDHPVVDGDEVAFFPPVTGG